MNSKQNQDGWSHVSYFVQSDSETDFSISVCGRDRWALERLIQAKERGCTPIDEPAPRWSGYVHNLRQMGVLIETVNEKHYGPFAGTHARYVLRCHVTPQRGGEAAA